MPRTELPDVEEIAHALTLALPAQMNQCEGIEAVAGVAAGIICAGDPEDISSNVQKFCEHLKAFVAKELN